MITDALNMFSEAQAITVTANSTNVLDLGIARDIGAGQAVDVIFQVGTAFTAAGAATLEIQLVYSAATNLGTPTVIYDETFAVATLVAGFRRMIKIARATGLRYMGIIYTVATGPMTAGTLSAFVSTGGQDRTTYARGYTVA